MADKPNIAIGQTWSDYGLAAEVVGRNASLWLLRFSDGTEEYLTEADFSGLTLLLEAQKSEPNDIKPAPQVESSIRKHSHYFKDVRSLAEIDVYRVLMLFEVTDPALQHIVKKALCAGKRGSKGFAQDVREIAVTANRRVEILAEDGE